MYDKKVSLNNPRIGLSQVCVSVGTSEGVALYSVAKNNRFSGVRNRLKSEKVRS